MIAPRIIPKRVWECHPVEIATSAKGGLAMTLDLSHNLQDSYPADYGMMRGVIRIIRSVVVFSFDLLIKSSFPISGIDPSSGTFCS